MVNMDRRIVTLGIVFLAGCHGRGLVDDTYPGSALATAHGSLQATSEPVRAPIALAILWLPRPGEGAAPADPTDALQALTALSSGDACRPLPIGRAKDSGARGLVAQPVSHTSALPFQFRFALLTPPPPEAELDLAAAGGRGRASVGLVAAYVDADGSGSFDRRDPARPDRLVALSADRQRTQAVVFLDGQLPSTWLSGAELGEGFSVVSGAAPSGSAEPLDQAYVELSSALVGPGALCP